MARRRTSVLVGVAVVLLAVVAAVLFRLGWDRVEAACLREDVAPASAVRAEMGWSWAPPGYTCTWDTGQSHTDLWW